MNENKILIESLSMDLLRVGNGYHKGSIRMAKRFTEEALKRIDEINLSEIKPYFADILRRVKSDLLDKDEERIAKNALMHGTLCENYARKYFA